MIQGQLFYLFGLLKNLPWLLGSLLWIFCVIDTLRCQREYVWILLLIFTGPVGVILYLLNFYVLEWAGWRRLDVIWKDRGRMRQLERELLVTEIPGYRMELAQIYFRQRRYLDCIRSLKPALDNDPENPRAQFIAGSALVELGRAVEAIPHLEYVVEEDGWYDFGEGPMMLAVAYELAGRKDDALAMYGKVLQKYRRADAVVRRATLLVEQGDTEAARHTLEQLLRESSAAPHFSRRAERIWIARAKALLRKIAG